MRIPCPCCGPRDHGEFTYLGDATVSRPSGNNSAGVTVRGDARPATPNRTRSEVNRAPATGCPGPCDKANCAPGA